MKVKVFWESRGVLTQRKPGGVGSSDAPDPTRLSDCTGEQRVCAWGLGSQRPLLFLFVLTLPDHHHCLESESPPFNPLQMRLSV